MSPITTLALADIGHRITIVDGGNTVSGPLTGISGRRDAAVIQFGDGSEVRAGSWDEIVLSIGDVQMEVSDTAKWKMGEP